MRLATLLCLIVFLIGLYFYAKSDNYEGLTNMNTRRCPDLLIQKGAKIYLYNSKLAQVPGVNPIEFENLEDYSEFLDWQRSQGIRCPVLYLQESYDPQGNTVYKVRPSISEPQGGLPPSIATSTGPMLKESDFIGPDAIQQNPNPTLLVDASRNDTPYNMNSYPGYDQSSYYVGTTTPLDEMNVKQETATVSPDPMDPNWGGPKYTQSLISSGYYKDNNVEIYVPS